MGSLREAVTVATHADRTLRGERAGRRDDALRVEPVVPVQVGHRSGLSETLDAQGPGAVTHHGAEPAERRRVPVEHRDEAARRGHRGEQALDMALGARPPGLAQALRGGPARLKPVGRGDGEQADVAPETTRPPLRILWRSVLLPNVRVAAP